IGAQYVIPVEPIDTPPPTPVLPTIPPDIAGAGFLIPAGCNMEPAYKGMLISAPPRWAEGFGDQMITVCAGVSKTDFQQGVVMVAQGDVRRLIRGPDDYLTPIRAGALTIIGAVGERLTLRTDNGTLFYFDVPTRQWVNPTPLPSLSPSPAP